MIEALALLALTIGVLFSGLILGALRQQLPLRQENPARYESRQTWR